MTFFNRINRIFQKKTKCNNINVPIEKELFEDLLYTYIDDKQIEDILQSFSDEEKEIKWNQFFMITQRILKQQVWKYRFPIEPLLVQDSEWLKLTNEIQKHRNKVDKTLVEIEGNSSNLKIYDKKGNIISINEVENTKDLKIHSRNRKNRARFFINENCKWVIYFRRFC